MSADRDGACPRCDLEYGHDEPCDRPVGEVPPTGVGIGRLGALAAYRGCEHRETPHPGTAYCYPCAACPRPKPDPYQALLTQLHEARAEVARLTVERDAAQEHVAYHLRDFRPGDKATGDLAVDMAAYSGRLKAEVERLRAGIEVLAPCADLLLAAEASWGGWAHNYAKLGHSLRALLDGEVRP